MARPASTPQQVALRSQIVLSAGQGQSDNALAQQLEINRKTVGLWRARFSQRGLDGLWEVAPGRDRKPTYGREKIQSIVEATRGVLESINLARSTPEASMN